jgi:hypothetical protein
MRVGLSSAIHKPKNYLLQYLKGCVLAFSYYQLYPASTLCIRIRRIADDVEQDFGFRCGYLDIDSVHAFLAGGDGAVTTWYNQSRTSGATNAVQATTSKQPLFSYASNIFRFGLYFNGSHYLTVPLYSELNLVTEPISAFIDFYKNDSTTNRCLFCKNTTALADFQYGLYTSYVDDSLNNVYCSLDGSARTIPKTSTYPTSRCAVRWQRNTAATWKIFKESNKDDSSADYGYDGYTITQSGSTFYIGCRGNTGGTTAMAYIGNIKTLLIFNTRQSRQMYDLIKREI